jgi:hypothetical protein
MLRVLTTLGVVSLLLLLLLPFQNSADLRSNGKRHLVLTNTTRQPISEVYVADDDHTSNWQEDVLGSEFLLPGRSVLVDIHEDENGNCFVDVKEILDNGSSIISRRLNSCDEGDPGLVP